ncbi:MAG: trypsin-like peptidase domain-containing protein [Sedimentisphaerales bacterium]|nr:trypsin-like peptidase domain-containing protein [Sedimentisphaerales bacterium]
MCYRKWAIFFGLAALAFAAVVPAVTADEQLSFEKSVVLIRCVKQEYDYATPWKQNPMSQGVGSGFVIAGKRILTNAHNVSNARYIELRKENIARRYPAKVAFVGHDCDLAILQVEDETFFDGTIALEFAELPKVNSTVSTYGFPMGGNHVSVTEGVVSRIESDTYVHSGADSHLVIQTDAAINPGNSGGPVIQLGKVVGVAFQGLRGADNIGYMIPTTVIAHFLEDIKDGEYHGFGSLGVMLYPGLHSDSYREYLKVPPDQDGVVVIATVMHSSVESILEPNDVITEIDDHNIDNDAMVRIHGLTLHLSEVIETKQIGQTVEITFYRRGEKMKQTAAIALNRPIFQYTRRYDDPPRYVCFAGLTFVPATRNFLETWGRDWLTDIPYYLRYLFNNSMQLNTDRQRKEYVVLSEIMPDEVNSYCGDFKSLVVESINGVPVWSLDDVLKAFEQPDGDFHSLKFMGDNRVMPIDAGKAVTRNPQILQKYNIPAEARLEGKS